MLRAKQRGYFLVAAGILGLVAGPMFGVATVQSSARADEPAPIATDTEVKPAIPPGGTGPCAGQPNQVECYKCALAHCPKDDLACIAKAYNDAKCNDPNYPPGPSVPKPKAEESPVPSDTATP